jgi:hypothetical protein
VGVDRTDLTQWILNCGRSFSAVLVSIVKESSSLAKQTFYFGRSDSQILSGVQNRDFLAVL